MEVPTEDIGTVTGINGKKEKIEFKLNLREIKHIRRCLEFYDMIHPEIYDEDKMSKELYDKFHLFGRRKRRNGKAKKSHALNVPKKCHWPGCNRTDVTFDHIIPLRAGGTSKMENRQWLCKRHHDLKNYKEILDIKEQECQKLKDNIQKTEEIIKQEAK